MDQTARTIDKECRYFPETIIRSSPALFSEYEAKDSHSRGVLISLEISIKACERARCTETHPVYARGQAHCLRHSNDIYTCIEGVVVLGCVVYSMFVAITSSNSVLDGNRYTLLCDTYSSLTHDTLNVQLDNLLLNTHLALYIVILNLHISFLDDFHISVLDSHISVLDSHISVLDFHISALDSHISVLDLHI